MIRVAALSIVFALTGCGGSDDPAVSGPDIDVAPLNVVVITLDTTRVDALGAYGNSGHTSPRIDAMAAGGALFEQALSSAPSTFPSHASLFTGRQPYVHGVRSNGGYVLSEENATLAEVLKEQGYRTGAEVAAVVLKRGRNLEQGFDVYRDPALGETLLAALEQRETSWAPTRDAEAVTRQGLDFLRENAEGPFFLWLHYFDPHLPHDPPEPFRSVQADPYFAEVMRVDFQVGRVLDEIERLGLAARTLVVLTADHGEGRGEHGESTHSFLVYDTTMRVPLIFWGARISPGRRIASLVRVVDVAPTIVDLLGLPPLQGVQGVSLRPLLEDPAADLELAGYGESIEAMAVLGSDVLRFVRVGRWKYLHKVEPELFDVVADPGETRNLAAEHPEVVARLRARLRDLLEQAPAKPADAAVGVDGETLAQLQLLGYAGGDAPRALDDELATLALAGPDPTTQLSDIARFADALGYYRTGNFERALELYGELWARNPRSAPVAHSLGRTFVGLDRYDDAIPVLEQAVELGPQRGEHWLELAAALAAGGRPDDAERVLRQALVQHPCLSHARLSLSVRLMRSGRRDEQLSVLDEGVRDCGDPVMLRNALAYLLATSSEDSQRDGERALRLARSAVEETAGEHPDYLDTLAAAYAETDDFERAVAEQERALAMIEGRKIHPAVRAGFERHLAAYRLGQPLRE